MPFLRYALRGFRLYTHQGLKLQPGAFKNQSLGPRPCETLVMALAVWAQPSQLWALRLSLHNTIEKKNDAFPCIRTTIMEVWHLASTWHKGQVSLWEN
jgi:hypothetical protein